MFAHREGRGRLVRVFFWLSIATLAVSAIGLLGSRPALAAGSGSPAGALAGERPGPHPALSTPHDPVPPQVLTSVTVGSQPLMAAYDPGNGYVYVVNSASENVSILNGTTVVATVGATAPDYVVYDGANGFVYVVDRYYSETPGGMVTVINGTQVVATALVGTLPNSAVVDTVTGNVYVTNAGSDNVSVIHDTSVLATVPVGATPRAAAFDPANGFVYVANFGSENLSVVNGTALAGSVPVGIGPDSLTYDPLDAEIYATNNGSNNVSIVSGLATVANPPVGTNPSFSTFLAAEGCVYVTNSNSSNLSLLSGPAVVATVAVGPGPAWVAFDPTHGFTYVVDAAGNAVTVLVGTAVLGTVLVGAVPTSATYDALDEYVYVTNSGSKNVSVLAPAYAVTFNETGLAPGTNWSVTLGSQVGASNTSSIGFANLPGTYPYTIVPPSGYRLVQSVPASPVIVTNASVLVNVTFSSVPTGSFALTFVETGLPLNCTQGKDGSGSYGADGARGAPPSDGCQGSSSPSNGDHGGCRSPGTAALDAGSWSNHGCPCAPDWHGKGRWCLTVVWSVTVGNVTKTSNQTTITFEEPNGVYNYTIGSPKGFSVSSSVPSSPVTINGANLTVNVTFVRSSCHRALTITFEERGLPRGTVWCVTLHGTVCVSEEQIVFSGISNGSYAFNVSKVSGYTANPASGTVTVQNQSVVVWIQFSSGHHSCGGGNDPTLPAATPKEPSG